MLPSIFGESLFDDWMDFPFRGFTNETEHKLYGKNAARVMKTDLNLKADARESKRGVERFLGKTCRDSEAELGIDLSCRDFAEGMRVNARGDTKKHRLRLGARAVAVCLYVFINSDELVDAVRDNAAYSAFNGIGNIGIGLRGRMIVGL